MNCEPLAGSPDPATQGAEKPGVPTSTPREITSTGDRSTGKQQEGDGWERPAL